MQDRFKRYDVDGDGRQATHLLVAKDIQLNPLSGRIGIGLFLGTNANELTGEPQTTQWLISVDQAEWLRDKLEESLRLMRRKS